MPRAPFLLALLCLPLIVGCEGCRRDSDQQAEDEKDKDAPLEDFTAKRANPFPADRVRNNCAIKPGHWLTASQTLKSNKVDSRGELQSRASARGSNLRTGAVETSQGEFPSVRPIVLPKGQQRRFDYRLLAPVTGNQDNKRVSLSSRFISTGRTIFYDTGNEPFSVLSGEEYFFIILTTEPQRFAKFQVSDWVRPFKDEYAFKTPAANFRIIFPATDGVLPLSETMLDWTGTAVVFWDDLLPDGLTPYQQQALADWVRFGGSLIVNGARASEAIAQTSIADLLPLKPTGNIELDPDAGTELLRGWSVKTDPTTDQQIALLRSLAGRVAVDGNAAKDSEALPNSGNLVLTRRVGNGRVVQPRFDVTSDWIANWQSFDSFVNAALLARPPREYYKSQDASDDSYIRQRYPEQGMMTAEAAMNTRLRITARSGLLPQMIDDDETTAVSASRIDPLTYVHGMSGIGGWTDDSDAIGLCRSILKSESGIEIPESTLVIRSLGYYLLILVPLNYLVFRLLGRLEYAWLAVPLIAVGGAVWVARAARLDIGFARKQTELAVLELQPDYHRGHLSRVIAIYNSLSSTYDVEFKTIDGAAVPVADEQSTSTPVFRTAYAEGPSLTGLAVESNKTQMLHTEQILDVGGVITMDAQGNLVNQSSYELLDAFVIERTDKNNVRGAMVGPCTPGSTARIRMQDGFKPVFEDDLPMQTANMLSRFGSPAAMPDGSMRLVARISASLPGMSIAPTANQTEAQTIVLAHLKHAPIPAAKPDVNLVSDFRKALGRPNEDDLLLDDLYKDQP